jgi:hypothetical protein
MATNNRSGNRGGSPGRTGQNNNPKGRNQYSGVMSTARDNPLAAAAVAGGAIAAGVFLWSRRNQMSDQISSLTDQITEWREGTATNSDLAAETRSSGRGARRSQAELSEEALTLKETGKTS